MPIDHSSPMEHLKAFAIVFVAGFVTSHVASFIHRFQNGEFD